MELTPGKEHEIKIINWKDVSIAGNFLITVYTTDGKTDLKLKKIYMK